jgi:hypothetical protein
MNYPTPSSIGTLNQFRAWGNPRETDEVVVAAIFAIADSNRSADAIWESPTPAEFDHVKMAVEEYVREGYFAEREDGCYHWGQEKVCI